MSLNRLKTVGVIAAVLVMLLGVAGAWWAVVSFRSGATGPRASGPRIKVGVIVSKFTATGPHSIRQPWGYQRQWRILRELRDPSFDIYPIIDPGTENDPQLVVVLNRQFPTKPPIDGASLEQLRTLDVIVASCSANLTPPQMDALQAFVSDGKGLLIRMFLGLNTPGITPQTLTLNGLRQGKHTRMPGCAERAAGAGKRRR